ncbi:MAG: hypothetical protein IPJ82_18385 [Lewinellaceae bacterium]|nr:hypothetical protein [Lewinellaceae bacterium]
MQNFLKQFRNHIENRPEPSFREEDWQGLQKRLDQQKKKHRSGFAWWVVLPLLFLLMGSNTFWYLKLQKAETKIYTIENQKDTIIRTQIVFHTDTVYITRTIREKIKPSPALSASSGLASMLAPDSREINYSHEQLLPGKPSGSSGGRLVPSSTPPGLANVTNRPQKTGKSENYLDNQPFTTDLPKIEPIWPELAQVDDSGLREIPISLPVSTKKKTFRQQLYAWRPKGFRLGASGGLVHPFQNEVDQQGGISVGLQGIIEFSPALQMWVDVTYFRLRFETNQMNESFGVPVVSPPSDDFVFLKAEAPQPSLQYSIGVQYLFNSGKRFRPFAGAGYSVVSLLPYEVVYEFQNTALGIDWSFDKSINRREVITDLLLLRAGFEYELFHRWNGQVFAAQRLPLGKTSFQSPPMLSIQAGLNYRF